MKCQHTRFEHSEPIGEAVRNYLERQGGQVGRMYGGVCTAREHVIVSGRECCQAGKVSRCLWELQKLPRVRRGKAREVSMPNLGWHVGCKGCGV